MFFRSVTFLHLPAKFRSGTVYAPPGQRNVKVIQHRESFPNTFFRMSPLFALYRDACARFPGQNVQIRIGG
jgi:hypothetical protein